MYLLASRPVSAGESRPSLVRRIVADLPPLRSSRPFRLIWTGLLVSELGYQFTLVAGTLLGSSFLDAFDRRRVLIWSQLGYMAGSALLLAGALQGRPPVGLVYLAVASPSSAWPGPTGSTS